VPARPFRPSAALPEIGQTLVVAVDGRSGAGKTALAAELGAELAAPVLALEDLYGGWDGLEHGVDLLASEVLVPLAAGRPARVPRYDWAAGRWAEPWVLDPPAMLIVEGVGAGARRAARYESALVWLDAPEPVRRQRALDRDGETFAPHWDRWAAQEEVMLARERTPARAGMIVAHTAGTRAAAGHVIRWLEELGWGEADGGVTGRRGSSAGAAQTIASGPNSMTERAASVTEPDSDG
jgi:hypothetical protein